MKPNIALKCALIFGTALAALPASADDERAPVAIMAHAGATSYSGNLSILKPAFTRGTSVLLLPQKDPTSDALGGIQGLFLVDFNNASTTAQTTTKFPFKPDSSLELSETSILPVVCALANYPVQACLGAGYTTVRVEDADNTQNYGAFRWELRLGHYLERGLIGGIEAHNYEVKQKVDGKDSSFNALSYQAGLGWSW
jgi:hypothetical protein